MFTAQPRPPPPPPPPPPPHSRGRWSWISPRRFGRAAASRLWQRRLLVKVVKARAVSAPRRGARAGCLRGQPSGTGRLLHSCGAVVVLGASEGAAVRATAAIQCS